jgi:hypothetical protein
MKESPQATLPSSIASGIIEYMAAARRRQGGNVESIGRQGSTFGLVARIVCKGRVKIR